MIFHSGNVSHHLISLNQKLFMMLISRELPKLLHAEQAVTSMDIKTAQHPQVSMTRASKATSPMNNKRLSSIRDRTKQLSEPHAPTPQLTILGLPLETGPAHRSQGQNGLQGLSNKADDGLDEGATYVISLLDLNALCRFSDAVRLLPDGRPHHAHIKAELLDNKGLGLHLLVCLLLGHLSLALEEHLVCLHSHAALCMRASCS